MAGSRSPIVNLKLKIAFLILKSRFYLVYIANFSIIINLY
ncbi:hypothetical protein MuYL_3960 [Mucilaginibacter xinganensis]|uniref:Uncharacterized protein n=1 Tax=Mucilaginibacter xinganensis TaxID=1234841 RepID=A0A223P152_9SPHI|nr:hypothetical protein MuYL_3960 [Mucilaginibacter xinganensis]